jgi:hypothetical protein
MGVIDPDDIHGFINRIIEEICQHFGIHRELVFISRSKDERRMNALITIVYYLKKHTILSHREIANIVQKDVSSISKYYKFCIDLDDKIPQHRRILEAIDTLKI